MLLDAVRAGECRNAETAPAGVPVAEKAAAPPHAAAARSAVALPIAAPPAVVQARYGDRRTISPAALIVTAAIHAVVVAGLFAVQHKVASRPEERLVSIDLTPPPPPPQAEPQPPAPPARVVLPPPPIELPQVRRVVVPPAPEVVVAQSASPIATVVPAPPAPPASPAPSSPPAPPIVKAGDLGTKLVAGKPPRYPIESRKKREQGTVVLALVLGLDGAVDQISVRSSSGHRRLDDAALSAVRKWRWQPTVRSGQPVKVSGSVEIPFVLQA